MTLPVILTYVLGPLENNSYAIFDPATREAVVFDPSFNSEQILADLAQKGLLLTMVLLTHAHFDHIAGVSALAGFPSPTVPVGLHPADLDLYQQGGGGKKFGFPSNPGPMPEITLAHQQEIRVGSFTLSVLYSPGHTPGHVVFYCKEASDAFCGDLIFAGSVGRTDLPGGSHARLIQSIRTQILPLPGETRLLTGHGAETTVADESLSNPFLI
jgi:hydroxyacylglutathione hydrolase